MESREADTEALSRFVCQLPAMAPFAAYRGYRELLESWAALPRVRASEIGRSVLGEPLWMLEIGPPEAKKASVVIAGIHPIEWIGVETAYALGEVVSGNTSSNRRVCFFPLANPDGFRKVEENLRSGRRKWVRSNENGVDLNRNWPTHFKARRGLIAGLNASGPGPCSEPEVAAIVSALDDIHSRAQIDIALSLHSIGNMILLPWGGKWKASKARAEHYRVARKLRARLGRYSIAQVSHWIPGLSFASGMELDHLHAAYGATSLLVECTRGDLRHFPTAALLDPFRIFNPQKGRERGAILAECLSPFVLGDWS